MTVATEALASVHEEDPKAVIWKALDGFIHQDEPAKDKIQPTGHDVIVCVYERPEKFKTKGGVELIMPATASRRSEDKFQGVVGMLVKVGPNYRKKCQEFLGLEPPPGVGDWVTFRTQDCQAFVLGDRAMRQLEGQFIRMVITDPDVII